MMKKTLFVFLFVLAILFVHSEHKVQAYTVDGQGRAQVTNTQDIVDALSVVNGGATSGTKPAITSNPPVLLFMNDITTGATVYSLSSGTATTPRKVIFDGNGYKYKYGAKESHFTGGKYTEVTFKNMNVGDITNAPQPPTDQLSDVSYSGLKDVQAVTDDYWGMYRADEDNVVVRFENINYVAGRNGQMLHIISTSGDNQVIFSGNNNILFPKGAETGCQELFEGPQTISVINGTTNIQIENNNVGNAVIGRGYATAHPPVLNVASGATLNFSDLNGKSYGFYYAPAGDAVWNIDGQFVLDTTGSTRKFFDTSLSSFTINVGSSGKFIAKGGYNWNMIGLTTNQNFKLNAARGSYIDWSKSNGRLFTGTPNASYTQINLHNPLYAAFRSSTNSSLFGSGTGYANLKINCDPLMAVYAYSTMAADGDNVEVDGSAGDATETNLVRVVRAVATSATINADFATNKPNALLTDTATLTDFKNSKAIVFKNQDIRVIQSPSLMQWSYSLIDVQNNLESYGLNQIWNAPRNSGTENFTMKLRDDTVLSSEDTWKLSVRYTPDSTPFIPLSFKYKNGTVVDIDQFELGKTSSEFTQGTWNTDYNLSYPADQGPLAELKLSSPVGQFSGTLDWIITDQVGE